MHYRAAREWGTTRVLSEVWVSDTMAAGRAISEAPYIVPPPGPPRIPERTSPPQPESTHHQQVNMPSQDLHTDGPTYGARRVSIHDAFPCIRHCFQATEHRMECERDDSVLHCQPACQAWMTHEQHAPLQVQPAYGAASHELRHTGAQQQQQQQPAGLPPQRSGSESYSGRTQPVARRPAAFAPAQHVRQEAAVGHAETQKYASKVPELAG